MILGILSVVFAASQQQHIVMLNSAFDIRLWLSRGKMEPRETPYDMPFKSLPLESSVSALKQFYMPKFMLTLSVWLYALGFGIFLLYAWLYQVEPAGGRNDFRNVFIAFVATVCLVCMYAFIVFLWSLVDAAKRSRDFDLDRFQSFARPTPCKQLEEWLKALTDMQSIDIDFDPQSEYAVLEMRVADLKKKWDEQREAREKRYADTRDELRGRRHANQNNNSNQPSGTQYRSSNRANTDPESASSLPKEVSGVSHATTWS